MGVAGTEGGRQVGLWCGYTRAIAYPHTHRHTHLHMHTHTSRSHTNKEIINELVWAAWRFGGWISVPSGLCQGRNYVTHTHTQKHLHTHTHISFTHLQSNTKRLHWHTDMPQGKALHEMKFNQTCEIIAEFMANQVN